MATDVQYEVGDWVYLKLQLHHQKSVASRPFSEARVSILWAIQVIQRAGKVADKLQFLESVHIHLVFHVSQLKKQLENSR